MISSDTFYYKGGEKVDAMLTIDRKDPSFIESIFEHNNEAKLQFLSNHYRHNPVVVRGNADRIKNISKDLFDLDVMRMIENSSSDQIHIWLKPKGSGRISSISTDDVDDAMRLYKEGNSLYCRAPASLESKVVARALNDVGAIQCPNDRYRRGEIEMFLSREGHLTDFHTDFQENFTVQLRGSKTWSFRCSTAVCPLRGCTPHYSADQQGGDLAEQQLKCLRLGDDHFNANQYENDISGIHMSEVIQSHEEIPPKSSFFSSLESSLSKETRLQGKGRGKKRKGDERELLSRNREQQVTLQPGDVLYHPAGIWHRVDSTAGDSISINISLIGASYAEVFCAGLQQLLWRNVSWRAPVCVLPVFRPPTSSQPQMKAQPSPKKQKVASNSVKQRAADNFLIVGEAVMQSILSSVPALISHLHPRDLLPFSTSFNPREQLNELTDDEVMGDDGNDGFTQKNDSSEEDEEDGEEDDSYDQLIDPDEVDLDEFFSHYCGDLVDSSDDDFRGGQKTAASVPPTPMTPSRGKLAHAATTLHFKVNPLAEIVNAKDLEHWGIAQSSPAEGSSNDEGTFEGSDDRSVDGDVYLVHLSFGNETLESVSRKVLHVPTRLRCYMASFLKRRQVYMRIITDALARYSPTRVFTAKDDSVDTVDNNAHHFTAMDVATEGKFVNRSSSNAVTRRIEDTFRLLVSLSLTGALSLAEE